MISIRDADKKRLIEAMESLGPDLGPATYPARRAICEVLQSIDELGQEVPYSPATVVPMTEADKRICYPERYK